MSPLSLYNPRSALYKPLSFQDMFIASSLQLAQKTARVAKLSSLKTESSIKTEPSRLPHMSATAAPSSESSSSKKAKKITFKNSCSVVLIPETKEYYEANVADQLWWAAPEYEVFQEECLAAISQYMKEKNLSGKEGIKQATTELYQPVTGEKCL